MKRCTAQRQEEKELEELKTLLHEGSIDGGSRSRPEATRSLFKRPARLGESHAYGPKMRCWNLSEVLLPRRREERRKRAASWDPSPRCMPQMQKYSTSSGSGIS